MALGCVPVIPCPTTPVPILRYNQLITVCSIEVFCMFIQSEMTAEEFLAFAEQYPDKRFDFIDGEIVEVAPKPMHGIKQVRFTVALGNYTENHPVGQVYTEVLHV